jgi:hypothetical protein
MFTYAIDPVGMLLVIDEHQAVPVYQLPRSATKDETSALAAALTELSACLSRTLGTFHRPPTRARMDERWTERRRESLGIIKGALNERPDPGLTPSDPRYRSTRRRRDP